MGRKQFKAKAAQNAQRHFSLPGTDQGFGDPPQMISSPALCDIRHQTCSS